MLPTLKHLTFFGFLAFTLVSADDPAGILAFPKDRHDSKQTNDTDIAIKQLLGDTKVYSYVSPYQGVAFWLAPMTQDQQDKIKAMPGIGSIANNTQDATQDEAAIPNNHPVTDSEDSFSRLQTREGIIKHRANAVDDLKLVSWASGKDWKDLTDYAYDEVLGTDTWIYLIEWGVRADHPEISGNAPKTPYFYGPNADQNDNDDSPSGRGTCMASKAVGPNLGVASNAHLIVVKAKGSAADNLWAFEQTRDDVLANADNRKGKSVVLFARGQTFAGLGDNAAPWPQMKPLMQELFDNDIVVVTSSGNNGEAPGHQNVELLPKTWATDDFPLIVVGAVTTQGKEAFYPGKQQSFSQIGPKVTVWAPGVDIRCADSKTQTTRLDTGTSPASAMAAGLVAYFLSFRNNRPFVIGGGNTARNARDYLKNTAKWVRPGGKDPAIWNGVDSLAGAVAPVTAQPTPVTPAPVVPQAPYAQGTCKIEVTQYEEIYGENGNYDLDVLMTDNAGNQIGYTQRMGEGLYPFSDSNPLQFQSKLEDVLTCKPEQQYDYIAFALGQQAWPSNGDFKDTDVPRCTTQKWDGDTTKGNEATRNIECYFVCGWAGGKSSDLTN